MTAYQRFVAAAGLTNLADGVAVVAWGWLTSLLTRDAVWIALVPVALRSPWFLLALSAGIVTDRVDRRQVILAMDVVRCLAFSGAAMAICASLPLGAAPTWGVGGGVCGVRVYRADMEHRFGQLPAAGDTRCDAGARQQSMPPAGMGDDARRFAAVWRECDGG